jgi:hypothetical protein
MTYSLARNQARQALAIVQDGYYILHLDAETALTERIAQRVVDVLNAAEAVVDHPIWMGVEDTDVALEEAVKRLRGDL